MLSTFKASNISALLQDTHAKFWTMLVSTQHPQLSTELAQRVKNVFTSEQSLFLKVFQSCASLRVLPPPAIRRSFQLLFVQICRPMSRLGKRCCLKKFGFMSNEFVFQKTIGNFEKLSCLNLNFFEFSRYWTAKVGRKKIGK